MKRLHMNGKSRGKGRLFDGEAGAGASVGLSF
jgi:hypothetical protein